MVLPREPRVFQKVVTRSDGNQTIRGIYELRRDTYRECWYPGKTNEVPKNFTPDSGNHYVILDWRRVNLPDAGKDEAADGIDGTWKLASHILSGKAWKSYRARGPC